MAGLLDMFTNPNAPVDPRAIGLLGAFAGYGGSMGAPQPMSRTPYTKPSLLYPLSQAVGGYAQGYGSGVHMQGLQQQIEHMKTRNALDQMTLQGYQRLQGAMPGSPPTTAGIVAGSANMPGVPGATSGGAGGAAPASGGSAPPSGGGNPPPLFNEGNIYKQYQIAASTPGMQQVAAGLLSVLQKGTPEGAYIGVDGGIYAKPGMNEFTANQAYAKSYGTEVPKAQAGIAEATGKPTVVGPGASLVVPGSQAMPAFQLPFGASGTTPPAPGQTSQAQPPEMKPLYTNPNSPALINMGTNQGYGDPPKDMAWARNQDGSIKLSDDGKGNMRPMAVKIAGGPGDEAETKKKTSQATATDIVTQDIGRVKDLIANSSVPITGYGSILSGVPGSPQYNAAQLLSSIKANAGFDRLQAMREASPTGGALGAVTEQEMKLLTSAMGSVEQAQSKDQLIFNLDRLGKIYSEIVHGKSGEAQSDPLGIRSK